MKDQKIDGAVEVFSTCPQSADSDPQDYLKRIITVAQWSEEYGCRGILVYSDNRLVDPWLVAQVIVQHTKSLCPLVAVQPLYMHPYAVAKLTSSFAFFYGRRIYLNMVAGGFKNDLTALNDSTPHDKRYERLREYTSVIKELLNGMPVTYQGEFYAVSNVKLTPPLPPALFPGIFMSGSSEAGLETCRALGAVAIKYPKAPGEEVHSTNGAIHAGIRVGMIAREKEDEAWRLAYLRFPEDRKGQLTHQVAMKVSDSVWHKQLSQLPQGSRPQRDPYWLGPFQNYKTFCPYLVGSYGTVSQELTKYIAAGYKAFILDIPPDKEELRHTAIVFNRTLAQVG